MPEENAEEPEKQEKAEEPEKQVTAEKAEEPEKQVTAEKAEEPKEQKTAEKLEEGDLAYLEFDMFIMRPDGDELYETTNEDSAKENDIYDEKMIYDEVPFIVGESRFLSGLDEVLVGAEVGKDLTVEVPHEKGAGERDPKLVEVRSIREFVRMKITPEVGERVIIGDRRATITSVTAGRVRVDFNKPLAGLKVKYNYKVARKAQTQDEKIKGIIDMDYGTSEEFGFEVKDGTLEIHLPDICKYDEKWFIAKYKVVSDLRKSTDLTVIRFVEEYEKKEKKEEEKEEPSEEEGEKPEEKEAEKPEEKEELSEEEAERPEETETPPEDKEPEEAEEKEEPVEEEEAEAEPEPES